jgi:DNA polymerase III epsilon subunit family exonuclease
MFRDTLNFRVIPRGWGAALPPRGVRRRRLWECARLVRATTGTTHVRHTDARYKSSHQPGTTGCRPVATENVSGPVYGRTVILTVPVPAPPEDAALTDLDFAVVDLETTGWSPEDGAITEIGAVRVRSGIRRGEFASLVNPGRPVPSSIEELTGITDWLVAAAPGLATILPGLLRFADGCVLVAHNAPFDIGFLAAACADCGLTWPRFTVIDTVLLARQVMEPDEVPDCKLGTLAHFFRAKTAPTHRALADARATADVLDNLIERLDRRGVHTLGQLNAMLEAAAAAAAAAKEAAAKEAAQAEAADGALPATCRSAAVVA